MQKYYVDMKVLIKEILKKVWLVIIVGFVIGVLYSGYVYLDNKVGETPLYYSDGIFSFNDDSPYGYGTRMGSILLSDEVLDDIRKTENIKKSNDDIRNEIYFDESEDSKLLLVSVLSENEIEAEKLIEGLFSQGIISATDQKIPVSVMQVPKTVQKVHVTYDNSGLATVDQDFMNYKSFRTENWDDYVNNNSIFNIVLKGIFAFLLGGIICILLIAAYYVLTKKIRSIGDIKANINVEMIFELKKDSSQNELNDIFQYIVNDNNVKSWMIVAPRISDNVDRFVTRLEGYKEKTDNRASVMIPRGYKESIEPMWMSKQADKIIILIEENEETITDLDDFLAKLKRQKEDIIIIFINKGASL